MVKIEVIKNGNCLHKHRVNLGTRCSGKLRDSLKLQLASLGSVKTKIRNILLNDHNSEDG
jgi:hypothetical protein